MDKEKVNGIIEDATEMVQFFGNLGKVSLAAGTSQLGSIAGSQLS